MSIASRTLCILSPALALLALPVPARADDAATAVPRYRLKVGQELKYRGTSEFNYETGSHNSRTDWQVWVVRQDGDAGWKLVIRKSDWFSSSSKPEKRPSITALLDQFRQAKKAKFEQPPDVTMGYCDLTPDGTITPNPSLGFRLEPSSIFPRLPKDADQAKEGWDGTGIQEDARIHLKLGPQPETSPDNVTFEAVRTTPLDKIYLFTFLDKYAFDLKTGMVKGVRSENSQGYGFKGKGTGVTELVSLEEHDADWVKSFAEESGRYFEANRAYEDMLAEAGKASEGVDTLLTRAESTLKDARETLTIAALREQADAQLKKHAQMVSYYAEGAKDRAQVLGHDAADWETKDLEGKTHSLAGYRGKVVILDFWYRGCGWCVRAMPQMKQLAEDFRGEPVAVLGMNTDKDEQDARFVVDAMGLNYPTLKAEGLPEKYKVRGFPTLIIIDRDGKVADVHVGYSPTLREEVSEIVKGLLARK